MPAFLELVGANRVLATADFPHVHFEGGKLKETFTELRNRRDIPEDRKAQLMNTNAVRFFGPQIVAGLTGNPSAQRVVEQA